MSEYIMDPGARLEVGPGGKPFESLGGTTPVNRGMGACCAACESSLSGAGGRGGRSATVPGRQLDRLASAHPQHKPGRSAAMSGKLPYIIGGVAVLGIAAFLVLRR